MMSVSFGSEENISKLIMVIAQLGEYMKATELHTLNWLIFMYTIFFKSPTWTTLKWMQNVFLTTFTSLLKTTLIR